MKIYIPFLFVLVCVVVTIYILYNPITDYVLDENIYGYDEDSFKVLKSNRVDIDKYYLYLDCYANNKEFDFENVKVYKSMDDCSVDINKINYLSKYYTTEEVYSIAPISFNYKKINKDNYKHAFRYLTNDKFNPLNFERYLNYDGENVVLNVNLDHDLKAYADFKTVTLSENVIVNKYNKLSDYNRSLSYCRGYYVYSEDMCNNMFEFLSEIDIDYSIVEVYNKKDLFNEHATGLAFNLEYDNTFDNYVEEVASRYGFIMRYKSDYYSVTAISEVGHFRYIGSESKEIFDRQISLEEYIYYSS